LASFLVARQFVVGAELEKGLSAKTNAAPALTLPAERGSGIKDPEHPEEDFRVHLQTNAAPATSGSTNREERFRWDVSWRGWNGLHLSISQTTHLKSPREMLGFQPLTNRLTFHLDQLKMTANLGAVIEVDGAAYSTTGNLDIPNDIQLRRARLIAQGACILILPVTYRIELGYIPHRFNLNQAWLESDHINYIGYVKAGVYQPPMGLDLVTSSRDLTFMEPASVLQALGPGNEAGSANTLRRTAQVTIFVRWRTSIDGSVVQNCYGLRCRVRIRQIFSAKSTATISPGASFRLKHSTINACP
jgi:hypothetical protein